MRTKSDDYPQPRKDCGTAGPEDHTDCDICGNEVIPADEYAICQHPECNRKLCISCDHECAVCGCSHCARHILIVPVRGRESRERMVLYICPDCVAQHQQEVAEIRASRKTICPVCGQVEPLYDDGTMVIHWPPREPFAAFPEPCSFYHRKPEEVQPMQEKEVA